MKEIFKPIKGYENLYSVSNLGRVYSFVKNKIRSTNSLRSGYPSVALYKNGGFNNKTIHRLVAEAFIPNPNNLPCVNHKDENKQNNNVDNLEWCTYEYNDNYGNRNSKSSTTKSKTIICIASDGTQTEYKNAKVASQTLGILTTAICNVVKGHAKTAGGYKWKYKTE